MQSRRQFSISHLSFFSTEEKLTREITCTPTSVSEQVRYLKRVLRFLAIENEQIETIEKWKIFFEPVALPTCFLLLLCSAARLRRVVILARLNHIFLVIVDAVAVNIDADFNLMLFAVCIAGIKREAVLAAQQGID